MTSAEQREFDMVDVTREALVTILAEDVEEPLPAPRTRGFVEKIEGFVRAIVRHEVIRAIETAKPKRKPRAKKVSNDQKTADTGDGPYDWPA